LGDDGEPTFDSLNDTSILQSEEMAKKATNNFKETFKLDNNSINQHMLDNTPFTYSKDIIKYVVDNHKLTPLQSKYYDMLKDSNIPIMIKPQIGYTTMYTSSDGYISLCPLALSETGVKDLFA